MFSKGFFYRGVKSQDCGVKPLLDDKIVNFSKLEALDQISVAKIIRFASLVNDQISVAKIIRFVSK